MGTYSLVYDGELSRVSDGNDGSTFLAKVYQKHRVGKDEVVGSFTDTINGIMGKLKNGGTEILNVMFC